MKKEILMVIVLVMLTLSFSAETLDRGLGFTAGKVSGIGLAYRQYFAKNGLQFTVGLLSNADKVPKFPESHYDDSYTKTGWEVDGWLSAMYLRVLRESELTKFYCFVGASINIDYKKKYTQEYIAGNQSGSIEKKVINNNAYYVGPGIGIEFEMSRYINLNLELPISISSDSKIDTYVPQASIIVKF